MDRRTWCEDSLGQPSELPSGLQPLPEEMIAGPTCGASGAGLMGGFETKQPSPATCTTTQQRLPEALCVFKAEGKEPIAKETR